MSALEGWVVAGGRAVVVDWPETGDCVAGVPYAYCPARTREVDK